MPNITNIYHKFLDDNQLDSYIGLMYFFTINFETYVVMSNDLLMIKHNNINLNFDTDFLRICNGLIINKNNIREIICYSGQNMKRLPDNINRILNLNLDLKKFDIKEIGVGKRIRLFYHKKWLVSINKIYSERNAVESKIVNSFKIWFNTLTNKKNFDDLDKDNVYLFRYKENDIDNKNIVLENVYNKKNNFKSIIYIIEGIYRLKNTIFKTSDMFYKTLMYQKADKPGYTLLKNNGEFFGIYNDDYLYSQELRKMEHPVDYIITFINLTKRNSLEDYLIYFPEKSILSNELKRKLDGKIQYFYSSYVQTKIMKQIKRDRDYIIYERLIIDKIHNDFITTHDRTTIIKVEDILLTLSNESIKTIIEL